MLLSWYNEKTKKYIYRKEETIWPKQNITLNREEKQEPFYRLGQSHEKLA